MLESPHRSGLERNPATANRGVDKLGLGCSQAFRPPHIANNSQRQKGGGEQGGALAAKGREIAAEATFPMKR